MERRQAGQTTLTGLSAHKVVQTTRISVLEAVLLVDSCYEPPDKAGKLLRSCFHKTGKLDFEGLRAKIAPRDLMCAPFHRQEDQRAARCGANSSWAVQMAVPVVRIE